MERNRSIIRIVHGALYPSDQGAVEVARVHVLSVLPFLVAGTPASADLLQRLAAHDGRARETRKRLVTRITIVGEELDGHGKATRRTETVVRVVFRGDREVTEVLRSTDDGKDVTESVREKQKNPSGTRSDQDPSIAVRMESPFAIEEQGKYAFEMLGVDPATSLARIRFSPRGDPRPELWTGEAVVDARAGEVVSMRSRPSKPPRFVDSMSTEIELGRTVDGTRMPSKVAFRGEGGFLFIRKRVRGWTEFAYTAPGGATQEGLGAAKP